MAALSDAVAVSILPGVSRLHAAAAFRAASADGAEGRTAGTDLAAGEPRAGAEYAARAICLESVLRRLGYRNVKEYAHQMREAADRLLAQAHAKGVEAVPWSDPRYPPALAAIPDPPPVLWVRGKTAILRNPAVAIVGSRSATPYALEVAEQLGSELSGRGITVVSGLARGVDAAAHAGALTAEGGTIGVLGSGVDVIYPANHKALAAAVVRGGVLMSELPVGTPPRPHQFPLRNRLISGLSRAVVIVEASERSGSLITAACGLEQGREVMAVPGSVLSGRNRGSHALLKDGAKIVETADDILDELRLGSSRVREPLGASLPADDPVMGLMTPGETYDLDRLAVLSGMDAIKLLPRLLELELRGFVSRAGGGRFVRRGRTC